MPILTSQHTLSANIAKQIVAPHHLAQHVCIHNHEHALSSKIFIGNSSVTPTTGIHAVATQTSMITIGPGDDLWAISDDNNVEIHILIVRQD